MATQVWTTTRNGIVYDISTKRAAWNAANLVDEAYYVYDCDGNLTGVEQEGCRLAASCGWNYELFSLQFDTTPQDFRRALAFVKLVARYCDGGFHVNY